METEERATDNTRNLIILGALTVDTDTGEIIEQPEAFTVDTPAKLNWWLEKMRQLRALAHSEWELGNKAMNHSQMLHRAADSFEQRYREQAEPVVRAMLPHGRRSILLEGGEAGFRTTPGSINILDALVALDWCKGHLPEAVKTTETLLKTPIAEQAKATGILPPGVEQVPPSEKMWVR